MLSGYGILETAIPAIVICTRDRARATQFYRDTLWLALAYEDKFAAVFNIGGVTLRVSFVADFAPREHTILGFHVLCVAWIQIGPELQILIGGGTRHGERGLRGHR